jgi:hypothetical protein
MPPGELGICGKPFIWGTCSRFCIDPGKSSVVRFKSMKTLGLTQSNPELSRAAPTRIAVA